MASKDNKQITDGPLEDVVLFPPLPPTGIHDVKDAVLFFMKSRGRIIKTQYQPKGHEGLAWIIMKGLSNACNEFLKHYAEDEKIHGSIIDKLKGGKIQKHLEGLIGDGSLNELLGFTDGRTNVARGVNLNEDCFTAKQKVSLSLCCASFCLCIIRHLCFYCMCTGQRVVRDHKEDGKMLP
jgi:hypothetical protein